MVLFTLSCSTVPDSLLFAFCILSSSNKPLWRGCCRASSLSFCSLWVHVPVDHIYCVPGYECIDVFESRCCSFISLVLYLCLKKSIENQTQAFGLTVVQFSYTTSRTYTDWDTWSVPKIIDGFSAPYRMWFWSKMWYILILEFFLYNNSQMQDVKLFCYADVCHWF